MSVAHFHQTFMLIEILQRKDHLLFEAWYLPPRGHDEPREHQPPMRVRYRTATLSREAIDCLLEIMDFGDLLTRVSRTQVTIQPVDGNGVKRKRAAVLTIAAEPEVLGIIRTSK